VGAVGARLLNSDGSLQTSCVQAFPTIWNQLLDCELLRKSFPESRLWGARALIEGESADAEVISGACFLVKRSIFEEVGHFGEEYFMYADDLDLSYKIASAGYKIRCLRECTVVHHGAKSSAQQTSGFAAVVQRESLAVFFHKTKGGIYSRAYRASVSAGALIRLAAVVALGPFARRLTARNGDILSLFRKWSAVLAWSIGLRRITPD
jgi:GT2 family glycosyltransferase